MSSAMLRFECPHCAQRLEIESAPEARIVPCPSCGCGIQMDPLRPADLPTGVPDAPMSGARLWRVALAALIGALVAYGLTWNPWLSLVGGLLGGLYGQSRNRNAERRRANDVRWQRKQALAGFRSTTLSWILLTLIWSWVLTRPPETFHDQGGMVITFVVLPATLALWIFGGPMAFLRGWNSRSCVPTPELERWVVIGLILSGLLTLAVPGVLAFWMRTSA